VVVGNVFERFHEDDGVEGGIGKRERARIHEVRVEAAVSGTAHVLGVDVHTDPGVASSDQRRAVSTCAAAHIQDPWPGMGQKELDDRIVRLLGRVIQSKDVVSVHAISISTF